MHYLTSTANGLRLWVPLVRRVPRNLTADGLIITPDDTACERFAQTVETSMSHLESAGEHTPRPSLRLTGPCVQLLGARRITSLLDSFRSHCLLDSKADIIVDVCPGKLSATDVEAYRSAGISQMLVLAHSTQGREMKALAPGFEAGDVLSTVQMLSRQGFTNYGVQLEYGLPGQTLGSLGLSLSDAYFYGPAFVVMGRFRMQEGSDLAREYQATLVGGTLPKFHLPDAATVEEMRLRAISFWTRYGMPVTWEDSVKL